MPCFPFATWGISNVHGSFSQVTGTVMYDDKNITGSSGGTTIQTSTVNTDNTMRDTYLKSSKNEKATRQQGDLFL